MKKNTLIITTLIIMSLTAILVFTFLKRENTQSPDFDGEKAYSHVAYQVNLGPRTIGSFAHKETQSYIQKTLDQYDWSIEIQQSVSSDGSEILNIIGKRAGNGPWIVIGAHYDSRLYADRDPDPSKRMNPVPGANDGASGVGILLELARVIPEDVTKEIWLVFFDAEDNGNIRGYDWILGSQYFAASLVDYPDAVIILDMVGDQDLDIYKERNSDPALTNEIWNIAAELGHSEFISANKYRIIDDHIPFIKLGIPAIDVIDFDYRYWHTIDDTLDKVSADSLEIVGETIFLWILR